LKNFGLVIGIGFIKNRNLSRSRLQKSAHKRQQRGLSCSVRLHKPEHLFLSNSKRSSRNHTSSGVYVVFVEVIYLYHMSRHCPFLKGCEVTVFSKESENS